jgi:hypothetical protein
LHVPRQNISAHGPMRLDVSCIGPANRMRHRIRDEFTDRPQSWFPRPKQSGKRTRKLLVLGLACWRSAAVNCDLRETLTGIGGRGFGGSARRRHGRAGHHLDHSSPPCELSRSNYATSSSACWRVSTMCSMGTPVTLRQARSCLIFAIADKHLRSGTLSASLK